MLTYSLENMENQPIYQYLYNAIKNDILSKKLPSGLKLPSKRSFAENLGVSVITVENTYSQLDAEGYIYSIPRKGYYISDISVLKETVKEAAPEGGLSAIPLSEADEREQRTFLADFTGNQIVSEGFPFSIWARLSRFVINNYKNELVTNSPCAGIYRLRLAIAKHLKAYRNMEVSPDRIIVGAGTEYLYGLLIQLLGFNKRYGIEDPSYGKIYKIYSGHRVSCKYIPMDEYGIIPSELIKNNIDIIHISPSHHFPTGIIMPVSRRLDLLKWAGEENERYIIEDDYDSEFRMCGQAIPAMQTSDKNGRVIYINTFSKSLSSTVRISYMVLPPALADRFYRELSFYSCTVSTFEQYTLAEFINGGYFEKHINRMRNYYRKKRDLLLGEIEKSPLSGYAGVCEQDAGLHFILKLNTEVSDETFCKETERRGIKLSALSGFYHNIPASTGHQFVINYSSLNNENIKDAIRIIYEVLMSLS